MSGNSGAEQLNITVSVPVKETKISGEETPVETTLELDVNREETSTIESEDALEIVEVKPNEVEVETSLENEETTISESEEIVEEIVEEVDETAEVIIVDNKKEFVEVVSEDIQENVEEDTFIPNDEPTIISTEIEVDISEVVDGFEEARSVLKEIYVKALNETFKPSLNDATVDLLAYVGARAESYGKSEDFKRAFGVDTSRFSDRYRHNDYLPIAFKISVWADKNKNLDKTVELLNGILQALFAFNIGKNEVETVEVVKTSIDGVIKYLESAGINSGF